MEHLWHQVQYLCAQTDQSAPYVWHQKAPTDFQDKPQKLHGNQAELHKKAYNQIQIVQEYSAHGKSQCLNEQNHDIPQHD